MDEATMVPDRYSLSYITQPIENEEVTARFIRGYSHCPKHITVVVAVAIVENPVHYKHTTIVCHTAPNPPIETETSEPHL
jgi:hypothetical protein